MSRRITVLVFFFSIVTICVVLSDVVTQQRQFTGLVRAELISQGQKPEVLDTIEWPNVTFNTSVSNLAAGKTVTTNFVCRGTSKKGRVAVIRLYRPAEAVVDLQQGRLVLRVPFEIELDHERTVLQAELTTGDVLTVLGKRSGSPVKKLRSGVATAALVGQGIISLRKIDVQSHAPKEFPVIIRGEGTITALN